MIIKVILLFYFCCVGLRQSFSGSEASTDVSVSSTENLSTSVRQEPQGEENQSTTGYPPHLDYGSSDNGYSILARLGMPTTALEMKTSTISQPYYQMAGHCVPHPTDNYGYLNNPCCGSSFSWHPHQVSNSCVAVSKTTENVTSTSGQQWTMDQLQSPYFTQLPPPPEYPGFHVEKTEQLRRSYETMERCDPAEMSACKSQPDLTHYWEAHSKMVEQSLQREDQRFVCKLYCIKLFWREGGGSWQPLPFFGFLQNLGIGNCTFDIVLMIFLLFFFQYSNLLHSL